VSTENALPYHDTKPQGAPDFYYETNARFRFLLRKFGHEGWVRYLGDLGKGYYAPVNKQWQSGGLAAVAQYWRDFFAAEPGSKVDVEEKDDEAGMEMRLCGGNGSCRHTYAKSKANLPPQDMSKIQEAQL